jgi:hypothetical protein
LNVLQYIGRGIETLQLDVIIKSFETVLELTHPLDHECGRADRREIYYVEVEVQRDLVVGFIVDWEEPASSHPF